MEMQASIDPAALAWSDELRLASRLESLGPRFGLTPAEREVLRWLRLGRTNREIGLILFKSEFTVKTHVQHMLAKTGLDNRLQLAALAYADAQLAR